MEIKLAKIDEKDCDRNVLTYGDVIRHMSNHELALFLQVMHADIETGLLAIIRAKSYPHRYGGDRKVDSKIYNSMYSFMEGRIKDEDTDGFDIFGIENWLDLCQWESKQKKNFGDDVVY